MNILFMGTPGFAVPSLEKILLSGHTVSAVITQPDRRRGRGRKITPSLVKSGAMAMGIPVLQPERVGEGDYIKKIRDMCPDAIVVVAYGQMLPPELLRVPRMGCVNLHGSLLPKYRGAAPIQRAVMNGEEVTGITTMLMNERMDAGDILLKRETGIKRDETAGELFDRLKVPGADLLIETLDRLEQGTITPVSQEEGEATYAPAIKKEERLINWTLPAIKIHNQVRGLSPRPGAYTFLAGKRIILTSTGIRETENGRPGEVDGMYEDGMHVYAGSGALVIKRLCPEGKREMSATEFAAGQAQYVFQGAMLEAVP